MPKYKIFSAIELGSAAVIMKIAQISRKNGVEIIESVRYNISLGSEVYRCGRISEETAEEICGCLEKCTEIMKGLGAEEYVCYATTAVREAENKDYFIDRIKIRCNIKVRIISSAEESFLHNKAFALGCAEFDEIIARGAVIVDVNSGNTQVSYYDCAQLKFSQAMPIGSLRVLELLGDVSSSPIGFSGLLEDYIRTRVENDKATFFKTGGYAYIAMTGSQAGVIKRICGDENGEVTDRQMEQVYELLKNSHPEEISEKYGISYGEAELLFPTVIIYRMFAANQCGKSIMLQEISTASGMCVEFAEKNGYTHTRHRFTNDIISAARSCAARFNVTESSSRAAEEYAEVIFNSLSRRFGLTKQQLLLLKLAVIFADTGKYINLNGYAMHSCRIVKSNPILGVQKEYLNVVAYAVGMLEGEIEDEEYRYLPLEERVLASKLSAVLRVARAMDVSHKSKLDDLKASVKDGVLRLSADTKSDITVEKLAFEDAVPFFKEVFGLKAELTARKK